MSDDQISSAVDALLDRLIVRNVFDLKSTQTILDEFYQDVQRVGDQAASMLVIDSISPLLGPLVQEGNEHSK